MAWRAGVHAYATVLPLARQAQRDVVPREGASRVAVRRRSSVSIFCIYLYLYLYPSHSFFLTPSMLQAEHAAACTARVLSRPPPSRPQVPRPMPPLCHASGGERPPAADPPPHDATQGAAPPRWKQLLSRPHASKPPCPAARTRTGTARGTWHQWRLSGARARRCQAAARAHPAAGQPAQPCRRLAARQCCCSCPKRDGCTPSTNDNEVTSTTNADTAARRRATP